MCIYLAEYFLEDSDLEGLSDITVSSVHTSDCEVPFMFIWFPFGAKSKGSALAHITF